MRPTPWRAAALAAAISLAASFARAEDEWHPPKDGLLTAKQADAYTGYLESVFAAYREVEAKREAQKRDYTPLESLEIVKKLIANEEAAQKASGLAGNGEFGWVSGEVMNGYMVLKFEHDAAKVADEKVKAAEPRVAAATSATAEVEAIRKSGRRPMSAEERVEAKRAAEADLKTAEEGLAGARAGIAEAKKDLARLEEELKKASEEERVGAKEALEGARLAMKDIDAQAKAMEADVEVARKRAAEPDRPATPDEKAAFEAELAAREQAAQADLERAKAELEGARLERQQAPELAKKALGHVKPENVEVLRSRYERIDAAVVGTQRAKGGK